jgi:hypothetical protein
MTRDRDINAVFTWDGQLGKCEICDSHSGDAKDLSLQECNTVLLNEWLQPLRRNAVRTQGCVVKGQAYSTQTIWRHFPAYSRHQLR